MLDYIDCVLRICSVCALAADKTRALPWQLNHLILRTIAKLLPTWFGLSSGALFVIVCAGTQVDIHVEGHIDVVFRSDLFF